jgi:hypothetical protein
MNCFHCDEAARRVRSFCGRALSEPIEMPEIC